MRYKNIRDEIKLRGYQYRMMRQGRGNTHEQAFAAGAQLILGLIKSGELSIKQIQSV